VALEAMLAAKPVLVSREAGIAAWVEKARAGFLAQPNTSSIHDVLADSLARRSEWPVMGQNGRAFAHKYLVWDKIAAQAEDCYRQLLGERRSSDSSGNGLRVINAGGTAGHSQLERIASSCL
jgi:glycosyltransferase involved in cell wall biosynthesis